MREGDCVWYVEGGGWHLADLGVVDQVPVGGWNDGVGGGRWVGGGDCVWYVERGGWDLTSA